MNDNSRSKKIRYERIVARGMDGPRIVCEKLRSHLSGEPRKGHYHVYFNYFMQPRVRLGIVWKSWDGTWSGRSSSAQFGGRPMRIGGVKTRNGAIRALLAGTGA